MQASITTGYLADWPAAVPTTSKENLNQEPGGLYDLRPQKPPKAYL